MERYNSDFSFLRRECLVLALVHRQWWDKLTVWLRRSRRCLDGATLTRELSGRGGRHEQRPLDTIRVRLRPDYRRQAGRVASKAGGIKEASLDHQLSKKRSRSGRRSMMARARSCSLPLTRSRNGVPTSTCELCSSAISSERSRSSGCLSEICLIFSRRNAFFCRNSSCLMAASSLCCFGSFASKAPRAVGRSAGLTRARFGGCWEWRPLKLQPGAAHLVPRLLSSHAVLAPSAITAQ
jgi:hypothetical protein